MLFTSYKNNKNILKKLIFIFNLKHYILVNIFFKIIILKFDLFFRDHLSESLFYLYIYIYIKLYK